MIAISFLSEKGFEEEITWKDFMKKFVNFLLTLKHRFEKRRSSCSLCS